MDHAVIENAKAYVKGIFEGDASGHDYWHTMRVYEMALRIGREEGADEEVVSLAALLHDVDDEKISPNTTKGLLLARGFMRFAGIEKEKEERICQIIEEISFHKRGLMPPSTLEGRVVQDADRLDAMGAIGIARAFAFGGSRGRSLYEPEGWEGEERPGSTVDHFYEKLFLLQQGLTTQTGRRLGKERDAYMRAFLDRFMKEWKGEA